MKFNAYIVELKQRENSFTGSLLTESGVVSANFRKIGKDIFIANFKTQMEFKFLETVTLKKRNKDMLVLLPVLSKYNKRKLTKISKFLSNESPEGRENKTIILKLLTVEKFLKAQYLLSFFALSKKELVNFLIKKEIGKEIKIIDFTHLSIIAYENMQDYLKSLNTLLADCYTTTTKAMKLSEIESKLKLPQSSLFFKYLLQCSKQNFTFTISKNQLIFQKLALSEGEEGSLWEIESTLKQRKLIIFSIEDILKESSLLHEELYNLIWFLIENGRLVQLNDSYYIFKDDLNKILNKLKKYKRNQGEMIDIQSFRELTLLTRRYIIILFEYFDSCQITQRFDNKRKILLTV
jgi:hypothetical protein